MFTVRLFRPDGIQLVFACHAYALASNYVNITRYDATQKEETLRFDVIGSPEADPGRAFARIEISNAQGNVVDKLSGMSEETRQQTQATQTNVVPMIPAPAPLPGAPTGKKPKPKKDKQ